MAAQQHAGPEPERVSLNGRTVAGIEVRTNNRLEMEPDNARLDRLWEGFRGERMEEQIPDRAAGSPVYGVYCDYEKGSEGDYTVIAGVEVTDEGKVPETFRTVILEAGEYLVFRNQGRLAEIVMETWSEVWRYFEREGVPERCFRTDYEVYESTDKVAIYIGVR